MLPRKDKVCEGMQESNRVRGTGSSLLWPGDRRTAWRQKDSIVCFENPEVKGFIGSGQRGPDNYLGLLD